MNLKELENKSQGKAMVLIKSRLREENISGFLKELDGFDILYLPLLYVGEPSNNPFKEWRKVDP